jgi:hypothetical protein
MDTTTPALLVGYFSEKNSKEEVGRSSRTMARWRALGESPPYLKLGREIFYNRERAKKWLESRERSAD